jgi:hypothetical protein
MLVSQIEDGSVTPGVKHGQQRAAVAAAASPDYARE